MKMKLFTALLVTFTVGSAFATESITENANATANDAKRAVKKNVHRLKEKVCLKDDLKCLQEKAKHRAQEAGDYMSDKASEVKDKVDSDSKAGN